jgi:peptidoglycan hydrolase-like protein with peptidoglycan-binding domain
MSLRKIVSAVVAASTVLTMAGPAFAVTAEELLQQIQQLQQQLNQLMQQYQQLTGQAPAGVPAACQGVTFTRNLRLGMSGADVKCLQALLNQDPATRVAESGPGSPGNETTYFGPKTRAAVIKFQEKYAAEILTPVGLTAGTGFVGAKTRAKLNALLQAGAVVTPPPTPPTPPVAAGLTVALAPDTPAATVLLGKQVRAPLLKLVLTNGDATAGKVTRIEIKRIGISNDGVLTSVYLLDEEGNRVGDEQIFSNGVAVFADTAGLLTIGAGQTVKLTVAGDVAPGQQGYTVGVQVTNVQGTFSALNAQLPITGNIMSIGKDIETRVNVDSDSQSSATTTVNPGDTEVVVWRGTINPNAKVTLSSVAIKAVGNIEPTDLQNFKFYLAGTQIGSTVQMGSDYVVKLNLAANPVTVTSGSKELKVVADVVKGTGRSVYFEIYTSAMVATDVQYGVNVPVQVPSGSNADWTTLIVGSGSITLQVASDSPVSVGTTTDALIAKYVLKAYGERVKIERFRATSSPAALSEVKIYVDGAEKGGTSTVPTTGTLIDTVDFYVEAGSSVTIEVKANTTGYSASTVSFDLRAEGTTRSGVAVSASAPTVSLDVRAARFTYDFANQPLPFLAVAGTEAMVARYKFKAEVAEATLKELRFTIASSSAAYALKVKIGTNEYSGELVGTEWKVANINYTVPAGTTAYADVYLTLAAVSSVTDGASAQVTLNYVRYSQAGTETERKNLDIKGAEVYVQKAVPEVTALTTGSVNDLNRGVPTTVTLYRWTIKAVGGDINATSNTTTLAFTKAGTSATTTIDNIRVYLNGVLVTSGVTVSPSTISETATSGTIVIAASGNVFEVAKDQTITIEVKADVTAQAGGWVRVWLAGDNSRSTAGANFVWHDGLQAVSGYLVKGLPAEGTDYYQHNAPSS